jgi:hypothetical protein
MTKKTRKIMRSKTSVLYNCQGFLLIKNVAKIRNGKNALLSHQKNASNVLNVFIGVLHHCNHHTIDSNVSENET